jgi:DNA-binding NarL/FixJ family response regulator
MAETRYIAIVDDHVLFRKGLGSLIDHFPNYAVIISASHGRDFIGQLNPDQLPHIVLLDIHMPEMDGYATAQWITQHHPEIKILALSTMDTEAAIIKMIKSGAKGYILKDCEPSELKLAFEEVLSRGYYYNEILTKKVLGAVNELTNSKNGLFSFIKLTDRELEFLKYTCTELTYKEIADRMFVSVRTVEGYRDALCVKLLLKSRVGLAMYAVRNNIVDL